MTDIPAAEAVEESDFSMRKMRVAFAVLLGTLFGSSILPMIALAFLLLPMTDEFRWTRFQYSVGSTALFWAGACAAPILGHWVDRIGVRVMIIGGTVVVGFVVMAMSLQDGSLWQFYGSLAVLGITGTTAIGYSKVIGALFNRHRGKALAIFGVESSLAGAAAPFIILWLIEHYTWRGMFVGLGLIILSVVPVLLFWLDEPAPAQPPRGRGTAPPSALPGLEFRDVLRTRQFWLLALAAVLAGGPAVGLMNHYVPHLASRGFDAAAAGPLIASMTVATAVGTLIGGLAVDWAKGAWIAAPFSILSALSLAIFLFVSSQFGGIALLSAAFGAMGLAMGAARPMVTYFQVGFFGLKSFGTVVGVQTPILALVMGAAPPLVGLCYDVFGSYQLAFVVSAASAATTVLIYLLLGPYRFAVRPPQAAQPQGPAGEEKALTAV